MQLLAVGDVPVLNLRHAMELAEACDGCLDPYSGKDHIVVYKGAYLEKVFPFKHRHFWCQCQILV